MLTKGTMMCSKPRFAFRPFVESLESRLQPGSMITGQGYGWSLLADNLLNLDQGTLNAQSLVSQTISESSKPVSPSTPVDVRHDNTNIAVTAVATAPGQPSGISTNNLVNKIADSLTDDNLGVLTLTGRPNAAPFVAAQNFVVHRPSATPVGT